MKGHSGWINSLKLDEANGRILSASDDGTVRVPPQRKRTPLDPTLCLCLGS
jgi:WD40 repeat protein